MTMDQIRGQLIKHGSKLFDAAPKAVVFTQNREADQLLNDLEHTPHAFVIACVMNRQMKAENAWLIPQKISQKIGGFGFRKLAALPFQKIHDLMNKPEPLHRFPREMSNNFFEAIKLIGKEYGGNAAKLWNGKPSSAEVVYRFLQFKGVGPKIATLTANMLARDFKVPFSDYYSIDVSVDVHVRRVFARLGLITQNATTEEVIYRARSLNPQFPGLLDFPAWEIGRNWCRPMHARCDACYMQSLCPSATV